MRELAGVVGRDIENVGANLDELAALGLVDLVGEDRAKQPFVPYERIEFGVTVQASGADAPA